MKTVQLKMEEIQNKASAIAGGAIFGVFGGFKLLGVPVNNLWYEFPLKMFGTVVLSAIGGLVGLIIKDFYIHKIKPKLFKKQS